MQESPTTSSLYISYSSSSISSKSLFINWEKSSKAKERMQMQPRHDQQQLSRQVAKTTTAVTVGGSLMVLSGLTLAATVIGLAIATPLLVIFSPVLVPAVLTLGLILGGFLASCGFGATASFVFYWMYRYVTGKHPIGATKIDYARDKLAHAAHDVKEKAEQLGHQAGQQIKG
ncbi:hypothetical protein RND71_013726 [Anisodus tanguticus]|uniref:Oleosin n=1 Tax=Anisodus tanguticus TaxID=243964 RepID=A0AAE1VJ98_9SOLA|nr:hypothetical protein RND71_013726 [Anisodus tanguticus]